MKKIFLDRRVEIVVLGEGTRINAKSANVSDSLILEKDLDLQEISCMDRQALLNVLATDQFYFVVGIVWNIRDNNRSPKPAAHEGKIAFPSAEGRVFGDDLNAIHPSKRLKLLQIVSGRNF